MVLIFLLAQTRFDFLQLRISVASSINSANLTSSPITLRMDFGIILLGTSPIPIGRTPGSFSSGNKRHARNADIPSG